MSAQMLSAVSPPTQTDADYRPIPDLFRPTETPHIPLPVLQRLYRSIPLRTSPTNASIMLRHSEPYRSLSISS
jgi:hypothetical protein